MPQFVIGLFIHCLTWDKFRCICYQTKWLINLNKIMSIAKQQEIQGKKNGSTVINPWKRICIIKTNILNVDFLLLKRPFFPKIKFIMVKIISFNKLVTFKKILLNRNLKNYIVHEFTWTRALKTLNKTHRIYTCMYRTLKLVIACLELTYLL